MAKNDGGFRIPPSASIEKILAIAALRAKSAQSAITDVDAPANTNISANLSPPSEDLMANKKELADAAMKAGVRDAMRPSPPSNVTALPPRNQEEVPDGFSMGLVGEIECYDGNMRIGDNPEYEAIKASIRASGFRGAIEITRRPGSKQWFVAAGSNTRLQILKDLFAETAERRFEEIKCVTVPYKGELDLLVKTINENTARGEVTLWEKAVANDRLAKMLAEERGKEFSSRELADELARLGLPGNKTVLSIQRFCIEHLSKLGIPMQLQLSLSIVRDLMPAHSAIYELLKRLNLNDAVAIVDEYLNTENKDYGSLCEQKEKPFSANELIGAWHGAVARALKVSRTGVTQAIAMMENTSMGFSDAMLTMALNDASGMVSKKPAKFVPQTPVAPDPQAQNQLQGRGMPPQPRQPPSTAAMPVFAQQAAANISHATYQTGYATDASADDTSGFVTYPSLFDASTPSSIIPVDKIVSVAYTLAKAAGIEKCFMTDYALPLGFYIELPEASFTPVKTALINPILCAWWVLNSVSLQHTPFVFAQLPESSLYQKAHTASELECENIMYATVGSIPKAEIMMAMFTFDPCWWLYLATDLMHQARIFRDQNPERFEFVFREGLSAEFLREMYAPTAD